MTTEPAHDNYSATINMRLGMPIIISSIEQYFPVKTNCWFRTINLIG